MMKKMVLVVTMLAVMVTGAVPTAAFAEENTGTVQQPIVGGTDVEDAKYPFVAALLQKSSGKEVGEHFCGASLIDSDSVLTAAHCVEDEEASGLQVGVGQNRLSSLFKEQLRDVNKIAIHPDYDTATAKNDAAVLTLSSPITGITPAVLATTTDDSLEEPGTLLTVAGWGNMARLKAGDEDKFQVYPDLMQEADVPVVSDAVADKKYTGDEYVPSLMVAAGEKGKDTCQGDSGGPLFANNGGAYVLVGITSNGRGCGAGIPATYTEVNESGIWNFITTEASAAPTCGGFTCPDERQTDKFPLPK